MFQKIALSIVLFFSLSIVTFFLLIKVIDFNEYKPKIHKAIKESTGYEVVIKGDIVLSLSPVGVRILDSEIINPQYRSEAPFATLESFDIALEIAPLLRKEIKIRYVSFGKLNLEIEKNKQGKLSYEIQSTKPITDKKVKEQNASVTKEHDIPLVNIKQINFTEATLHYEDLASGLKFKAERIDMAINDISFDALKQNKLQGLFLKAEANIEKITVDTQVLSKLSMNAEMKDAVLVMDNLKYTLFDSQMQGSSKLDLSGKTPKISLKSKIAELKLQSLSKALWGKEFLHGNAIGEFKLACSLGDMPTIKSTLGGFIFVSGENILLKGYDVDKIASSFNDPKNGSLLNLFSGKLSGNGESIINHMIVKSDIGYSEAKLSDVALSTAKHRIALKGALQIVEEKFLDVKVAILDAKGCSSFEQTIIGTFKKPALKVDETTINTIANAAISLLGKSKKTTNEQPKADENCTPFYEGLVKHPEMK